MERFYYLVKRSYSDEDKVKRVGSEPVLELF